MTRAAKIALAAGSVAVAGLVVGLLVGGRSPTKRRPPREETGYVPQRARATDGTVRPIGGGAPVGRPEAISLPGDEEAPVVIERDGGTYILREHETGDSPRRPSPIIHVTVAQVRAEAQPLVRQCAAPLRQRVPPVKGRIQVTAMASSAGGRVVVHDSVVKLANLEGETELAECLKNVFDGISFDAPVGQGDGEQKLHLPFVVP